VKTVSAYESGESDYESDESSESGESGEDEIRAPSNIRKLKRFDSDDDSDSDDETDYETDSERTSSLIQNHSDDSDLE